MAKQGVLARPDYMHQSRVALGALDLAQFPVGGVEFLLQAHDLDNCGSQLKALTQLETARRHAETLKE
jgi:hypothetical protein